MKAKTHKLNLTVENQDSSTTIELTYEEIQILKTNSSERILFQAKRIADLVAVAGDLHTDATKYQASITYEDLDHIESLVNKLWNAVRHSTYHVTNGFN